MILEEKIILNCHEELYLIKNEDDLFLQKKALRKNVGDVVEGLVYKVQN